MFLTYDEELEISDHLVARRALRDSLRERDLEEPETPEEREVWNRGNESARKLVEGYMPFVRSLARSVILKKGGYNRGDQVTFDDLVQQGAVAMLSCTWAYDARGPQRHDPKAKPGVRFARYCQMHVLREMNRLVDKMSTPMYVNVDVIGATWTYLAVEAELEAELGRKPTREEVEERSEINTDYIERGIPSRVAMPDVDDVEIRERGSLEEQVQAVADTERFNAYLDTALREVLNDDLVDTFMCFIGADRGVPRDASEVAKELKMTRSLANEMEQMAYSAVRHPQYRVQIYRSLRRLQETGVF